MNGVLVVLLVLAMLATVGVLIAGLFSMARGGDFNRRYGNKLMRWRVVLQGTAVLLFLLLALAMQR